jgi:arabinofuranan 3-O-arabinosyltransferase
MRIRRPVPTTWHPSSYAASGVYLVLLLAAIFEKYGKTTNDTKTPLIESPDTFLHGAISLWNPQLSFGELQNQAYGYLFPQGPFYLLAQALQVPPWVSERIWSWLILVVGCEGGRRVARAMGMPPWAAWVAGMAYGLNPRVISQVAVRSGEILPGAVLPWVLLPIVLTLTGRLGPRRAALFSVAAFMFSGAVNGTATAAPLPLVLVIIVWGIRRGMARWSLLGWWAGILAITSFWWAASLLRLNSYSPPFFDYVEDAKITTGTTGHSSSLRGASNWVNYIFTGSFPTWPAGAELSYTPWLVLASGALAALGVIGLVTWRSAWRAPLVVAATLGLACLTVGHAYLGGSPLSSTVHSLLDGLLALLRNVHKVDPVLRLPIALGVGAAFTGLMVRRQAAQEAGRRRRRASVGVVGAAVVALTLSMAQPAIALNLRTPGWDEVPDYWHQAADYLENAPGDARTWVIPGSGFGVQTWGWTMDEPMSAVASTPWVTRSQVPLVPPQTIRVMSRLEEFLASGAGSANLGGMLARLGIGHVVVRHDLDPTLAEATSISLVSIAMARSEGVTREAAFGAQTFGPAIEIYSVDAVPTGSFTLRSQEDAVTVAGASSDVIDAVGQGLIGPDQAAVVQGDSGWDRPAEVVGDTYRLRERNFGRVHDAEGPTLAPTEPLHDDRIVPNYPGNPGSEPVTARYTGVERVVASSSQAYTDGLGPVRPEAAPFSAVDADPLSGWRTGYFEDPVGQWLEIRFDDARDIGEVILTSAISNGLVDEVRSWLVEAGGVSRKVTVDPFTGAGEVDLTGVRDDRLRVTVDSVRGVRKGAPISLLDVDLPGPPATRTLVVPAAEATEDVSYVFTARPEVRTCITTLIAPDCNYDRGRLSEESLGLDRTFTVPGSGTWSLSGTVVARARPETSLLLDPFLGENSSAIHASSTLASDPTVAARLAYDGNGATSWMADPYDTEPTLTIDFARPTKVSRLGVAQPAQPAITPTQAVIRAGDETRVVELGDFGAFEPVKTRRLEITFSNPTRGLSPIGIGELHLGPKPVTVPFDGATATGAVCGFGPQVEVDGRRFGTRVSGFMGNVVSAGPLQMSLCDPDDPQADPGIELDPGEHHLEIVSTEQFQPVLATLRGSSAAHRGSSRERSMTVLEDEPSSQQVRVGPGAGSLLATTRNYNRGWVATMAGIELPAQRIDGWAQGWRVPEGDGGVIEVRYAPERSYVMVLVGGLALSMAVLLLAMVPLVFTRLRPERPVPELPEPARARRRGDRRRRRAAMRLGGFVAPAVAVAGAGVLGGVPAAVGLALAGVLVRLGWERTLLWLAGALLIAGPAILAIHLQLEEPPPQPLADILTGTGFVLAAASVLPWRARTRRAVPR